MANYNDDLDDDLDGTEEEVIEENGAQPASNRNFIMALGILGGIFLLLVIALVIVALTRPRQPATPPAGPDIAATNAVISTSNAVTAAAATQARGMLLTPSVTPTLTVTPTVTRTSVLVATNTPEGGAGTGTGAGAGTVAPEAGGALTPTATGAAIGQVDTRTATLAALQTMGAQTSVAATQIRQATTTGTPVKGGVTVGPTVTVGPGTGTPTRLPQTGFAEDVGLPGLFGMALGLVVVIVIVRRLRLSTQP